MRRRLRFVVILVALAVQPVLSQDLAALRSGVVKVTATVGGRSQIGTGFVVNIDGVSAYIVTAAHVVEGDHNPKVELFEKQNTQLAAEVLKLDPRIDLALLKISTSAVRLALELDLATKPKTSDEVATIGFPRGGSWLVSKADVAGMEGADIVVSGAAIDAGNSGGPVIKAGKVIAVVRALQGKFAYATPASVLAVTLEGWGVSLPEAAQRPLPRTTDSTPQVDKPALPPAGQTATASLTGEYAGRTWSRDANGQSYVCDFISVMSQQGTTVTGEYTNTCGDRGTLKGEVTGNTLRTRLISALQGYMCDTLSEIAQKGASISGDFVCNNGLRGTSSATRR